MFFKTFVTQYQTTLFPPSPPRDLFLWSRSVRLLATGLQRARFTWKKKLPERPLLLQHYLSGLYSNFPRKRDVVNMQPIFFFPYSFAKLGVIVPIVPCGDHGSWVWESQPLTTLLPLHWKQHKITKFSMTRPVINSAQPVVSVKNTV